jgi:hypothetical protein
MFYSPPAVKTARKNIKLLSAADKLAIKKIKNEKYKNVLGKQEKQLNHYLSTYTDPDYLPQSITKEYEFPKYFYYTVNKRDGTVVQKRTRVDSKTFKNFMKNTEKQRQAKEQGLYNITNNPININIDMPAPTPKFKKPKSINDILGNVNFGDTSNQKKIYGRDRRYEDTGPSIIQYSEKLPPSTSIIPFDGEELIESIPSYTPIKKNIDIKKIKYDEDKLSDKEIRAILAAQPRVPLDIYVWSNWKKFRDLLESVGQTPHYDKRSTAQKAEWSRLLAHDFFKQFFNTRTGKLMITTPSDYKKLKSFGTRNYLIYRPTGTTKQEKEIKLKSEREFIDVVLKIDPSLEIIPFIGEDLIESIPSYTPIKKNITIKSSKKNPFALDRRKQEEKKIDITNRYTILGISPYDEIDFSDIKKIYKKLALQYHPDKAKKGDAKLAEKQFILIDNAYKSFLADHEAGIKFTPLPKPKPERPRPASINEEIANREEEIAELKEQLSRINSWKARDSINSKIESIEKSINMLKQIFNYEQETEEKKTPVAKKTPTKKKSTAKK